MKRSILHPLLWCALFAFLFSFSLFAQKQNTSLKSSAQPDLYIAGNCDNVEKNIRIPLYMKNDKVGLPLTTNGNLSSAYAIAVSGNDVYVTGAIDDKAVYWKNGQLIQLQSSSIRSSSRSIAIDGEDIYVTGIVCNDPYWTEVHAVYWKNGQEFQLPSPDLTGRAWTNYIAIVDKDIYVIGRREVYEPVYWKNGQIMKAIQLERVSSISSFHGDTYAAGAQNNQAAFWKNGQTKILSSEESLATVVAVAGNDVYVGGIIGSYAAKGLYPGYGNGGMGVYWKNGQQMKLNGAESPYPTSMAAVGEDIYIVGFDQSNMRSILWKNGQPVNLINNESCFRPYYVVADLKEGNGKLNAAKVTGKNLEVKASKSSSNNSLNYSKLILGEWELTKNVNVYKDREEEVNDDEMFLIYQFKPNGIGIDVGNGEQYNFKYTISGDKVTRFYDNKEKFTSEIEKIDGNSMVLKFYVENDERGLLYIVLTFERMKK